MAPNPAPISSITVTDLATFDEPVAWITSSRFGDVQVMQRNGLFFSVSVGPPVTVVPANQTLPDFVAIGEGGVLDAIADPRIVNNDNIFVSYTAQGATGTKLVVVRGSGTRWTTVFETPEMPGNIRFGGQLAFTVATPQESNRTVLLISVGDRGRPDLAQNLSSYFGKTVRVYFDQSQPAPIIASNPYYGVAGALPEIWTLGHRELIFATASIAIDRAAAAGSGDAIEYLQRGCSYPWPSVSPNSPSPLFTWTTPVRPLTAYFYDGGGPATTNGDLLIGAENYAGIIQMRWNGSTYTEGPRIPLPAPIQKIGRFNGRLYAIEAGHQGRLVRLDASY